MISKQFNYDQDLRKRQIDTLKVFNDNVQEIKENEEYAIQFQSGGRLFTITTYLGPNFPNDKPRIIINPPVQHQWCNGNTGEIENAPGLLNYTHHSDLGRVVQAIIREYEKFPPTIINENIVIAPTTNHHKTSAITDITSSTQSSTLSPFSNTTPTKNFICNSIPELSKLSLEDLKKLDSDSQFFDDFIEEMSIVQSLNDELDLIINQVENISKENQSKEAYLNELKQRLSSDVHTLKTLGEKCEKLNQKYQKKSEELSPQHIRELLQIAASNADTVCEKHVEQFLNGKMDVQTFLNFYTKSKKLSAMRKAKEERLAHQLNELEKATTT